MGAIQGPEDDLESADQRLGTQEPGAAGTQSTGGMDVTGRRAIVRLEELVGRYGGLILAAMERPALAFRSRFAMLVGARAESTGEIDEVSPDGTPVRVLADEMGRLWVRLASGERYAIVGEKQLASLDRLAIGRPTSRSALLASSLTMSALSVGYAVGTARTIAVEVRRGSFVTIRVRYAGAAASGRPILIPEMADGSIEYGLSEFVAMRAMNEQISVIGPAIGGVTVPAFLQGFGTLVIDPWVADPPGATTVEQIVLQGWEMRAGGQLRFACIDAVESAGAITVMVSQE